MKAFALVDCNNFYASCERVFEPRLVGRPIVVLSNNDGCVIARSAEAKTLGIEMGAPYFQVRDLARKYGVVVRSSNYALYGDMSNRVMSILAAAAPRHEVYSIDECFLDLSRIAVPDIAAWCANLRERVRLCTGIPVSIGIGPTKTLAKLSNKLAKTGNGVHVLAPETTENVLRATPVGSLWGIGPRWRKMLAGRGICTALDFRDERDAWVRQRMGVTGLRIVHELRGVPCLDLEEVGADKQATCCSRTFARAVSDESQLRAAVICFAERAAEKVRHAGQACRIVQVSMRTDRHDESVTPHSASGLDTLLSPTADSRVVTATALRIFEAIWKPGILYRKASVLLMDLSRAGEILPSLFDEPPANAAGDGSHLMSAVDRINARFGRGAVGLGLAPPDKTDWRMRQEHLSPRYTTRWTDLPRVRT